MRSKTKIILTVEHGGNSIPAPYRHLFRGASRVLQSHRGWDQGAHVIARELKSAWRCPLTVSTTSRLLIDLNRSLTHQRVFSEWTKGLDAVEKEDIIARYYQPYRSRVEQSIKRLCANGYHVLHVSVHSFTPVFEGVRRKTDLGILYDPQFPNESALALLWQRDLRRDHFFRDWHVHRNRPYQGKTDGFASYLRRMSCKRGSYRGIEIEINQKFLRRKEDALVIGRELSRVLTTV